MTCACGHWHGALHCEGWMGDHPDDSDGYRCPCTHFRTGAAGSGSHRRTNEHAPGRNISSGATAFVSPLYHMQVFSLRNPVVLECIERGWYIDLEDRPPHTTDNLGAAGMRVANQLGIEVDRGFWAPLR